MIARAPSLKFKTSAPVEDAEQGRRNVPFALFCLFIVGYYLHITARIPVLGKLHYDLLVASIITLMIVLSNPGSNQRLDPVAKRLWILLGYIIVTIPFVEWPGSVLRNLEPYAKSLCFFFFVLATVDTTRKLRLLLAVFCATQVFRVLEPLYMHVTSGYWGSRTSLENWEYMSRLNQLIDLFRSSDPSRKASTHNALTSGFPVSSAFTGKVPDQQKNNNPIKTRLINRFKTPINFPPLS